MPFALTAAFFNEKKRSERRKHCARAGCSKVRTPPASPLQKHTHTHTNRQDRLQYTAPLASAQCNCLYFSYFTAVVLSDVDVRRRLWEMFWSQSEATGQGEGRGGTLNEVNIRPVLNSLNLFPTRSQGTLSADCSLRCGLFESFSACKRFAVVVRQSRRPLIVRRVGPDQSMEEYLRPDSVLD